MLNALYLDSLSNAIVLPEAAGPNNINNGQLVGTKNSSVVSLSLDIHPVSRLFEEDISITLI